MPSEAFLEKEKEDKEARREYIPAEAQIENMHELLRLRYADFLDSLSPAAQKAFSAAGAAYGYEAVAKLIEAVEASPKVERASTPRQKTEAVMQALKEAPMQQAVSTEIHEVSHFAWSYYNKELGRQEVTLAKTESVRDEFEVGGQEGKKKDEEDDERKPLAMRAARGQSAEQREMARAIEEQRIALRVVEKIARINADKLPNGDGAEIRKSASGKNSPKIVVSESEESKVAYVEAKKALKDAEKARKVTPIIEFSLKKEGEKEGEMRLLEVDEKRLAIAEAEVEKQIAGVKAQIMLLGARSGKGGAEKLADGGKKEKAAKLRILKRKLAFWQKAHGALRRLSGGFFGGIGKMLGGIFK